MNHLDMSQFIAPKSDQINADDLIAGPMTIHITRVSGNEGSPEQPVNIYFDGDDGKPYRPCKSMRRVMVAVWGPDAAKYVGRSMTLYRDPGVQFGGMKIGGIRISHMTDIPADKMDSNGRVQMSLTTTRAKRSPYIIQNLEAPAKRDEAAEWAQGFLRAVTSAHDAEALDALLKAKAKGLTTLESKRPELHQECTSAVDAKRTLFVGDAPADDAFADDSAWAEAED